MTEIRLKKGKENAVRRGHPWVFSGAISKIMGEADDGDRVMVSDVHGKILGYGHYHDGSIAVRMFHLGKESPSASFWEETLREAYRKRQLLGLADNPNTDCYRLIHGEGDNMPGLIVDIYGKTAVLQCHSIGMHKEREELAQAIYKVVPNLDGVYDKSRETLPKHYAQETQNGFLVGEAPLEISVKENSCTFLVNPATGQKTGFFLDQRNNRNLLGQYCSGKTVLNTFCYSGGFSVYALKEGASKVVSVDISSKAMALTDKNIEANQPFAGEHQSVTADVLKYLSNKDEEEYDIVVVDPPAFAKSLRKKHNAVKGYKRLNALAFNKVKPGGMMFTFSCSQVIDPVLFENTIVAAALEAGRRAYVVHRLQQPPDHPTLLFHPEGSYLKGLVLIVD